jgi:hypothetical protein
VKRGVIRKSKNEPPLIPVVFAALCGCEEGIENIESAKKDFPYKIFTEICDVIKTEDKCFDGNRVFSSDDERSKARQVALRNGKQLVKRSPPSKEILILRLLFSYFLHINFNFDFVRCPTIPNY